MVSASQRAKVFADMGQQATRWPPVCAASHHHCQVPTQEHRDIPSNFYMKNLIIYTCN